MGGAMRMDSMDDMDDMDDMDRMDGMDTGKGAPLFIPSIPSIRSISSMLCEETGGHIQDLNAHAASGRSVPASRSTRAVPP